MVSGWALGELGLSELILEADEGNAASIRVAEKCGFSMREDAAYRGESVLLFRRRKTGAQESF